MNHQIIKPLHRGFFVSGVFSGDKPGGFDKIAGSDFERTQRGPEGESHGRDE
jgi:hypothetical protein